MFYRGLRADKGIKFWMWIVIIVRIMLDSTGSAFSGLAFTWLSIIMSMAVGTKVSASPLVIYLFVAGVNRQLEIVVY